MDGSPVVYTAWNQNEPNFANNDENCVTIYKSMGKTLSLIYFNLNNLVIVNRFWRCMKLSLFQDSGMTSTVEYNYPLSVKEASTLSAVQLLLRLHQREAVALIGPPFREK